MVPVDRLLADPRRATVRRELYNVFRGRHAERDVVVVDVEPSSVGTERAARTARCRAQPGQELSAE